jgi:pimeloyl-ACP methyl ester carboxylesterase
MRRVSVFLSVMVLSLLAASIIVQGRWQTDGVTRWPPAGEFLRLLDGRRLHLVCAGEGEPAVILEASGPGNSDLYASVLPAVAQHTRVCAYDRAGMGYSDAANTPRTLAEFSADLSAVADHGSPRPVIIVAASFGGFVAQDFARRHPERLAGLVLLDAPSPELLAELEPALRRVDRAIWISEQAARLGLLRLANPLGLRDERAAWIMYRATTWRAVGALIAARHGAFAGLPPLARDLPLRVIRHGRVDGNIVGPALPAAEQIAFEPAWRAAEAALAAESQQGALIVAERSGHLIAAEQPELVVKTIVSLLD